MFLTILAIITRISANSWLNVLQKRFCACVSSLNTNFKTYFLLFVVCLPFLLVQKLTFQTFLIAFVSGIFGALGNAFLIEALRLGELSVLGPINSYKAVFGLLFGIVLIGEVPSEEAILGIFLILFGSYFIFETINSGFSFSIFKRKDIIFRFLALFFTALEAVFIKKVILLSGVFCSFLLWSVFGCLFSFIILKLRKENAFNTLPYNGLNLKKEILPFVPLSVLVLIMQLSTNFVFSKVSVALALSLFQLSNILNVFLGYKVFREKNILKKIFGSIIMIVGAVIILVNR